MKLLPCYVCGGEAVMAYCEASDRGHGFNVVCKKGFAVPSPCKPPSSSNHTHGPWAKTRIGAQRLWNKMVREELNNVWKDAFVGLLDLECPYGKTSQSECENIVLPGGKGCGRDFILNCWANWWHENK